MDARVSKVKRIAPMCLALAGALSFSFARSQEAYPDLPTHAHYTATEQGWTCNDGFKQVAGYCMQDSGGAPSQGPFELFDGQWRCRSGYKRAGAFCVTPAAPDHATLVEAGGRWECDWGYRRVANRCEEISPPAHAYLDAAGHDWVCYPGFEKSAGRCNAATSAPVKAESAPAGAEEPPRADPQESK
jgi:hypothetical protein